MVAQSEAIREQVELQREMHEASTRPFLYASATPSWSKREGERQWEIAWNTYVPVTNSGLGPAMNIRGRLHVRGDQTSFIEFIPTSLPAGASAPLLLANELSTSPTELHGTSGSILYQDIRGTELQSTFKISWTGTHLFIESSPLNPEAGAWDSQRPELEEVRRGDRDRT